MLPVISTDKFSLWNQKMKTHRLGQIFPKETKTTFCLCVFLQWREACDLRPEAAFNLSLIYIASGNRPLALHILRQYCRV